MLTQQLFSQSAESSAAANTHAQPTADPVSHVQDLEQSSIRMLTQQLIVPLAGALEDQLRARAASVCLPGALLCCQYAQGSKYRNAGNGHWCAGLSCLKCRGQLSPLPAVSARLCMVRTTVHGLVMASQ